MNPGHSIKPNVRKSAIVTTAEIKERHQFSHSTLSELRQLEIRLLLLPLILRSSIRTIGNFETFANSIQIRGTSLKTYGTRKRILG